MVGSVSSRDNEKLTTGSEKDRVMKNVLKSSFTWQFLSGFVLGTIGFVALQPAQAADFDPAPNHQVR